MRRRRSSWLIAALCLLLSVGLHGALLVVLALWWTPDPQVPGERVTYVEFADDPDVEPPEPEKARPEEPEQPPEPLPPEPEKKKKKPELEFEELPEPEEEEEQKKEEPEPEPEPEQPQEKVDLVLEQLKMVEQPDELDEQEAPEDVNYLSNVNRDVKEETRAKVTNLDEDAVQPEVKQVEPSPEPEPGTANSEEIAQREEQKSQLNKQAPDIQPDKETKQPEMRDPHKQSLLAMRELEKRDHQIPEEKHEALTEEADDGSLKRDQQEQASIAPQDRQARVEKKDEVLRHRLALKDFDALYGKDVDAKKRSDAMAQSKTKGVWEEQKKHWQSPLENMVPEVQPGNQTALRSRKHPFARYIAQMHRKIHEAWAWGFLEQLDTRGRNHPLNDYDLWTRVEVVLDRDGTIEKVTTVHFSGKMAFDAAAREIVFSAGPFPDPPQSIVSGNGKIYVHWAFHRDERACGTFGAQPFILDGTGLGDRPDPDIKVRPGRGGEQLGRRLKPGKPSAPAVAEGPAPPPGVGGQGSGGHDHDHDHDHGDGGGAKGPAVELPSASPEDLAADPHAAKVANAWLAYFAKKKVDKVIARSSLPFHSGDAPVARTREELRDVLQSMAAELGSAKPKAVKVYTAAGLRKVFGSVPAGVQEGQARVYALTKVGSEYVILLLEKSFSSWRVVGLTR